jgi:hypothetical protein
VIGLFEGDPTMANQERTDVWATVSLDRQGNIVEVKDAYGKVRIGKMLPGIVPEKSKKCPEGETSITAVKTVEIVYITCADTKDPCWVYDPVTKRWYYVC